MSCFVTFTNATSSVMLSVMFMSLNSRNGAFRTHTYYSFSIATINRIQRTSLARWLAPRSQTILCFLISTRQLFPLCYMDRAARITPTLPVCKTGDARSVILDNTLNKRCSMNGFPLYQRSSNGFTVVRGRHEFTNCDVVPFNPYLSAKFNCHINVKVATTVTAVKYLFKYVYKGHDRAVYQMVNDGADDQHQLINEIDEFLDGRYVSAPECVYRIFAFPLQDH